jgi:hypothetical protein
MAVCGECCVLTGRGLCDELITCPEESYRLWYVVVCDLKTSRLRRLWPALGRSASGDTPLLWSINLLCGQCEVRNDKRVVRNITLHISYIWILKLSVP